MSNVEEGGVCNKKTMTIGKGREKEEEEKMGKWQELGMGKDMCNDLFFSFFSCTILCSSCQNVRIGKNGILKLDGVYIYLNYYFFLICTLEINNGIK